MCLFVDIIELLVLNITIDSGSSERSLLGIIQLPTVTNLFRRPEQIQFFCNIYPLFGVRKETEVLFISATNGI